MSKSPKKTDCTLGHKHGVLRNCFSSSFVVAAVVCLYAFLFLFFFYVVFVKKNVILNFISCENKVLFCPLTRVFFLELVDSLFSVFPFVFHNISNMRDSVSSGYPTTYAYA